MNKPLKYYFFLFRWFLIGKYHCDFKNKLSRRAVYVIHRLLVGFIIFSCTMSIDLILRLIF